MKDVSRIAEIYDAIHTLEEAGEMTIGWARGVYPTADTAREAVKAGDMFVLEKEGRVVASGRINRVQMPAYREVSWRIQAEDDEVMVLHTLVVDPAFSGQGFAREFLCFYEDYALSHGCPCLRIDTNERNLVARAMYAKHGYEERGIIPCTFNGIEGVGLVCMEKRAEKENHDAFGAVPADSLV
ncbi:MAG: GNAT family N-acetyltransferase [Clostridia bacterium]|nr:GNAT family N-acetyltransferase [Clostridia bacterium]